MQTVLLNEMSFKLDLGTKLIVVKCIIYTKDVLFSLVFFFFLFKQDFVKTQKTISHVVSWCGIGQGRTY